MRNIIENFKGKTFAINAEMIYKNAEMKCIAEAKKTYRESKISYKVLLDHYYLSRAKAEELARSFNPADILHNDGYKGPESGETSEDAAFKVAALNLKNIDAMTVIAGIFYGSNRDDSKFELSCYLAYVEDMIRSAKQTLVVNPSPHMLKKLKSINRKISCIVTDDTVAQLYRLDYRRANFYTFEELNRNQHMVEGNRNSSGMYCDLGLYDLILVTARDHQINEIIRALSLCSYDGRIVALVPENMLNRKECDFAKQMRDCRMRINGIVLLHGKMLGSSPKYKMLMDISICDRYRDHEIPVLRSLYDVKQKELQVSSETTTISSSLLFKPIKLRQKLKSFDPESNEKSKREYNVSEYQFTEAIRLRFSLPGGKRQNKYLEIRYKAITQEGKAIGEKMKNKKVTKALKSNPNDDYIEEIERAAFNPIIRNKVVADLLSEYKNRMDELSFKDLWYVYHDELKETSFNDSFAEFMFFNSNRSVANLVPAKVSGEEIKNTLMSLLTKKEGRGIKYLKTMNAICRMAKNKGAILSNPIPELLEAESREANKEEREIRNADVKKTLEISEENAMVNFLLMPEKGNALPKCITSGYWFMVLIRLFTGISVGEAAALRWGDYRKNSTGVSSLEINKNIEYLGKLFHYNNQNTKRRDKEVCTFLDFIIQQRRDYLINQCGVKNDKLIEMSMLSDNTKAEAENPAISRKTLGEYCKQLLEQAEIPELILQIPTEDGFKETDVNQYAGDIFRTNYRLKAKIAGYTEGELEHSLGISSYRPFENNYCDYYNDMSIYMRAKKLDRWTCLLEDEPAYTVPTYKKYIYERQNTVQAICKGNKVPNLDILLIILNSSPKGKIQISIQASHGIDGYISAIEKKQA